LVARAESLPALLADALNETVVMTIDGRRRKLTAALTLPPPGGSGPGAAW